MLSEFMSYSYLALKQMNSFAINNQPEVLEENLRILNKIKKNGLEFGLIYFSGKLQELEGYLNNFKKDENLIINFHNFSDLNFLLQELIEEYNTLNLKLGRKNIKQVKDKLLIDKNSVDLMLSQLSVIGQDTEEQITHSLIKAKGYIYSLDDKWLKQ